MVSASRWNEGRWLKIPQIGRVVIGDDVEIGANTTIDRGALDDTVIEDGVKLDNQIQVAHNVRIGAHTAIAGCVGIAGSTTIGHHCRIGGRPESWDICDCGSCRNFVLHADRKIVREAGSYAGIFPFSRAEDWRRNSVHLRHQMTAGASKLEQQLKSLSAESLNRES